MKKAGWFARPGLSLLLATSWLLLQQTLAPFHLISAVLIGLLLPRLLGDFLMAPSRLRFMPALRLVLIVLWDIVLGNIAVARLVLGPISRPQPAWVTVPLALRHPTAVSMLASIITTTPGTVSCLVDEERRHILVHALDCSDPAQMAADIKVRYEIPLLAIFEPSQNHPGESA
ncbi:MAG: Na+/H+ antiporter subunit E [Polaromonas sp.]|uniref:Na+/H+ antiporter subunit E n=1 Tax=Polaromonas sp. TaxID=1869339 RepID=UPI0027317F45|nr:Na+/H+ antiporter subunit E [Polaromonas sp.]MDP1741268.1 Na+/H+ antiporter subunit E [Polaromonas sp.]MDP3356018.1 Na+/H+ antiporter subunit E [Polaromonas sp.]